MLIQQIDRLDLQPLERVIFGRTLREAHAHAAKTDGRDFQITFSEFARLHDRKIGH
jgi:hypothetical protein